MTCSKFVLNICFGFGAGDGYLIWAALTWLWIVSRYAGSHMGGSLGGLSQPHSGKNDTSQSLFLCAQWLCSSDFLCLQQIIENNDLKGKELLYVCTQFKTFQCLVAWPHCCELWWGRISWQRGHSIVDRRWRTGAGPDTLLRQVPLTTSCQPYSASWLPPPPRGYGSTHRL